MSDQTTNSESCQVDFYLLGQSSPGASQTACRLALMSWERKQKIFIMTDSESTCEQLDKLMWRYPEGRFLPHNQSIAQHPVKAPVVIGTVSSLNSTDVVINLCAEPVPQPERFSRILEIVPFAKSERQASRLKYKTYLDQGIKPQTQELVNP